MVLPNNVEISVIGKVARNLCMCMKSDDVTDAGKIQSFIKVYQKPRDII